MYYEELFDDAMVIRKNFPSELLPYIWETQPQIVSTVSSTSIEGLRDSFEKCIEFNFSFSHYKQLKTYTNILLL